MVELQDKWVWTPRTIVGSILLVVGSIALGLVIAYLLMMFLFEVSGFFSFGPGWEGD